MDIYEAIKTNNIGNGQKKVMSITTDDGDKRAYTYTEMFSKVDIFAKQMKCAGVETGDRVIIVAENSPEWNIAYLSIMLLKCTAVLIDFSLPTEEILRLIEVSDARCVFTSPKLVSKLDCVISTTIPVLNILSNASTFPNNADTVTISKTIDGDSDVAFIIYSSGTTKTATGIMHTHKAMLGTTYAAIKFNNLKSDEKMLVVIPNSHIYGVVTSMLGPLILGGSMHFIESMTGENVLRAFKEYQPTVFSCVPKVFEMFEKQIVEKINSKKLTASVFKAFFPVCLKLRQKTGFNLGKIIFNTIHEGFGGHIRIFCAAGAPLNEKSTKFYYGVGLNLFLNYGLTETNVPVIANSFDNYTISTCGKSYPHVQTKLVPFDNNGNCEIYLKTPYMMKGYFRDAVATAEAFSDGWFKTGDIGVLDPQGNISVVGRCKDNIVLATGKKVTPDDVELQYANIKGVKEFVVCGIPALAESHDEIHAFVVCDDFVGNNKKAVETAIFDRSASLSQYMKIIEVHFVNAIEKTSLQKPKRYLLKNSVQNSIRSEAIVDEKPVVETTPLQSVIEIISRVNKSDTVITEYTLIFEDLGLDSLKSIELDLLLEERFGMSVSASFYSKMTVSELVFALSQNQVDSKSALNKMLSLNKKRIDYAVFKFFCGLTRWVYKVDYKGLENLPADGGYIICPNHQTNFDFLWVTMKFGKKQFQKLGCMAKQELFNPTKTSKLLARVCGMIPIDRTNNNSQAIALCKQKLKEGWNFLIYPEGTRTVTGEIGEFKKGAAMISISENVPIVPVKIKGGFEIFPAGHKLPKLFDFKKMRRLRVEVAFASPISGYADIDSLNNKLKDVIVGM